MLILLGLEQVNAPMSSLIVLSAVIGNPNVEAKVLAQHHRGREITLIDPNQGLMWALWRGNGRVCVPRVHHSLPAVSVRMAKAAGLSRKLAVSSQKESGGG